LVAARTYCPAFGFGTTVSCSSTETTPTKRSSIDRDWARKLVKPFGAVIAFHDYAEVSCPGVKQALDEWAVPTFITDTLAVYSDPRYPVNA